MTANALLSDDSNGHCAMTINNTGQCSDHEVNNPILADREPCRDSPAGTGRANDGAEVGNGDGLSCSSGMAGADPPSPPLLSAAKGQSASYKWGRNRVAQQRISALQPTNRQPMESLQPTASILRETETIEAGWQPFMAFNRQESKQHSSPRTAPEIMKKAHETCTAKSKLHCRSSSQPGGVLDELFKSLDIQHPMPTAICPPPF